MSIKSTGDSSLPPLKTLLTNPQDGEALTYNAATGTFVNGIPFTTIKPVLTSPSNASALNSLTNYTFQTSTAFSVAPANYLLTHYATDWQIASDAAFTSILTSTTLDTSNKTSWTAQFAGGYSPVYVRLRFHNGQEYSQWSDTVQYSVIQIFAFTSSSNHTIPNNTNTMEVNVLGGGSGSSGSHGGGGGGYTGVANQAVTPGATLVVTVGAGSVGSNTAGTSSFGNLVSANGGTGNGTSGNGYARGGNSNGGPGGGGAGGAGSAGGGPGYYGPNHGGAGGPGVSHSIDSVVRGGGGGGATGASGNRHYGNNGGSGGSGGGGAGRGGGSEGWQGTGADGTNGMGGGAGSPHGPHTNTGGNGRVVIKYSA
jgi:hypothetical protein